MRMTTRGTSWFWWATGSIVAMAVGALGPWARIFGLASIGGLDGSNDGWLMLLLAAVAAGGLLYRRSDGLTAIAGALGLALGLYERAHIEDKGGQLVQVGWGLNLATIGAASLVVVAGIEWRASGGVRATLARPDDDSGTE